MRSRLEHLDATGLDLQLGDDRARVVIGTLEGLRGVLTRHEHELGISDAGAHRGEITSLHLEAGPTTISTVAPVVLESLRGALTQHDGRTTGELDAERAVAMRLSVTARGLAISGHIELGNARLRIDGIDGSLIAERVVITDVSLTTDTMRIAVQRAEGQHVTVAWGRAGFRMHAGDLVIARATVEATLPTQAHAPVVTAAESAAALAASMISPVPTSPAALATVVGSPAPTGVETAREMAAAPDASADTPPAMTSVAGAGEVTSATTSEAPSWLATLVRQADLLALLDGAAGDVNADLALDLTVPVLGRRRATHRFRIPIVDGTIDYRQFENDLSTLENALLDFAMRDSALVLEMGIPFVPTRGLGKPILRWDLAGDDVALAHQRRIRLAMLPRFKLVADGGDDTERTTEPRARKVALRQLELRELAAVLRLQPPAPPSELPLRRIDELSIAGTIYHAPEAPPRPGELRARVAGVELGALAIPTGALQVGFEQLALASADDVEVTFTGIRPQNVRVTLHDLRVRGLAVIPPPS